MTSPEVALLMLSLFIMVILLGFPVAFTLLAMGVGFGYYAYYEPGSIETFADVFNNKIFYLLNQNTYSVMENDTWSPSRCSCSWAMWLNAPTSSTSCSTRCKWRPVICRDPWRSRL